MHEYLNPIINEMDKTPFSKNIVYPISRKRWIEKNEIFLEGIRDVCEDAICGSCLGIVKGVF